MSAEINTVLGFGSLKDVLEVLLIPIALAVLAPWITRRWRDRQRDSEIKTELVSEISRLVMTTVMTVYLFRTSHMRQGRYNDSQEHELERIYRQWKVDACIIGSKLHAYFPDKEKGDMQIHKKWDRFSGRLSKYYENNSARSAEELNKDKEGLFEEKARIIEDILTSKITGFRGVF